MFRIRSMCRRNLSYIIIKDTQGSLIMYFNYTLFKLYVYATIFFIAQCWFWGRVQLVLGGASNFLGGASKFSNLLAPRATASTSLMSRPAYDGKCNVAEIGAVNMGEIGAVARVKSALRAGYWPTCRTEGHMVVNDHTRSAENWKCVWYLLRLYMATSINVGANVWHWWQNFKLVKSIEISLVILTPYLHFKKIVKLLSSHSTWPCESTSCKYVSRVKGTPIWKCNCVKMLQIIHISPGLHHLNTSFLHIVTI